MKKLLALLLALMLPLCAAAETYHATFSVAIDDAVFSACIKDLLRRFPGVPAENQDRYIRAASSLLNNLQLNMIVQEDACSLDLTLNGNPLMDLIAYSQTNISYITTSLLPGYALSEKNDPGASLSTVNQLDDAAIAAVAFSIENAVSAWLSQLESTVSHGAFVGDAFDGGSVCTTWVLSDKDVADFVSALATDEARAMVAQLLREAGSDASMVFSQFDAMNERVASGTEYLYILRVVEDDKKEFVGLSLTVLKERSQLATVSVGREEDGLRAVIGLGLTDRNYWREYVIHTRPGETGWEAACAVQEWIADKAESFSYVRAANVAVESRLWECAVVQTDGRTLFRTDLYAGNLADDDHKQLTYTAEWTEHAQTFSGELCLLYGTTTPLKISLIMNPTNPIPPMDSSLIICATDDAQDAELAAELNTSLTFELSRRMLMAIPLDVILLLGN